MTKTIRIDGINCGHCSSSVDKALRAVAGVTDVKVDLAAKTAAVEAEASASDDALKAAVTGAGFTVVGIQ